MAIQQVPTSNNQQYTLNTKYTASDTSIVASSTLTGTVQAPGVCVVDRVDSNNGATPTKRTYYYFTGVSGSTLTGVSVADGTDQDHAVGAILEFVPDVKWAQSIYDALTKTVVASTGNLDTTKVVDLTTAQVLTNKDLSSGTNTLPTTAATLTGTQTLTNKRITKRVLALSAGSATPAINTDSYDVVKITAQNAAITSFTTNLTGTPVDGDTLRISITDDGTARALTWGTSFEASGTVALPTTTVINTRLDVGFFWNVATSKWRCVASA